MYLSRTVRIMENASVGPVGVTLAPNPATDRVILTCADERLWSSAVEIVSVDGRVMAKLILAAQTTLTVQDWPTGVYLVRLPDGAFLKLVKN